jgi:hypothetical protein
MTVAPVKTDMTFLQVAEVWALEGDRLVLYSGNYGERTELKAAANRESFAFGEGLPGKAWAEARPIVVNDIETSTYFKRKQAARDAGITSAVAVPIFAGDVLKAVLVVMCGDDQDHVGAIEVWREQNNMMLLDDGAYGAAKDFEAVSRETRIPRGQGLPGWVAATLTPVLMRDLGSGRFLRADAACKAGLTTGLGLPVPTPNGENYVLTLLSSLGTPIARRFEIWDARAAVVGAKNEAILIDGFCAHAGRLWPDQGEEPRRASAWSGLIGRVLGSGIPLVQSGTPAITAGYDSMVALPVYRGRDVAHIVAWYC